MSKHPQQAPTNNNGQIVRLQKSETFSGPVPPPEVIEKYERILPGAAERIFTNWEKQTEHRHNLESRVVKTDNLKSILGVVFGFIAVMGAIWGGVYTALHGYTLFGGGLSLAGLAMLVTAFVTSRKKIKKEEGN